MKTTRILTMWLLLSATFVATLHAQKADRPLTNADVINMVKSNLPESVIVSAIQSHPGKFDTSTSGLIALHRAGITENEMNAMIAASGKGSGGAGVPRPPEGGGSAASAADNGAMLPSKSRMPRLIVVQGNSTQELKLEKTQLAETKTKPSSMKALAADSAVTQAMQAGVGTATYAAATHMNSGIGGSTVQQAGSIFSGVMSHRTPTVTYVWGVPGPASEQCSAEHKAQLHARLFSHPRNQPRRLPTCDRETHAGTEHLPCRRRYARKRRHSLQSCCRLADVFAFS